MHFPCVLIVDDQADQRNSLAALLKAKFNITPVSAESADAALELLRTEMPVHLVISDYVMPGMDGVRFAAEVRRLRPNLRVILMTGHDELLDSIVDAGVIPALKPVAADTLASVLQEHLRPS